MATIKAYLYGGGGGMSGEITCDGDSELCEELKEEAEDALKEGKK